MRKLSLVIWRSLFQQNIDNLICFSQTAIYFKVNDNYETIMNPFPAINSQNSLSDLTANVTTYFTTAWEMSTWSLRTEWEKFTLTTFEWSASNIHILHNAKNIKGKVQLQNLSKTCLLVLLYFLYFVLVLYNIYCKLN